jgi:DNA mismatch repair protein MSH6
MDMWCQIEVVRDVEVFPKSTAVDADVRKRIQRPTANVHPWDVDETLKEMHRRKYYPQSSKKNVEAESYSRWPPVLRAAVAGGADLAISSFGACLFYLQRNLIDHELLTMGIVKAYIPPSTSTAVDKSSLPISQLASQQSQLDVMVTDDSVDDDDDANAASVPVSMTLDVPVTETLSGDNEVDHLALDGTTLHNLDILYNSVDLKVAGSLWSKINYTQTPHGARLLRAWLLRPMFRPADIARRADAVQELSSGGGAVALKEAIKVLSKCGDIERLLSRVHSMSGASESPDGDDVHPNERAVLYETATYVKRKVGDFSKLLKGLQMAAQIPEVFAGVDIQSGMLAKVVRPVKQGGCFPDMSEQLEWFIENFNCDLASKGLFEPTRGVDALFDDASDTIGTVELHLSEYKDELCTNVLKPRSLAKSSWKYINTKPDSKDKYLIELPASVRVPDNFILKGKRGNGYKQVNKYRYVVVHSYDCLLIHICVIL